MNMPVDFTLTPDLEREVRQALAFIKTLPQVRHIRKSAAAAWVKRTVQLGDHGLAWHVRRLRGFGSSEIGACVTTARGEFAPFQNSRDVVMSKLMMLAPDAGTGHTRRGNAMEAMVRGMFHERYRTKTVASAIHDMGAAVVKDAPWMVGNPDDVCEFQGGLWLVDYKAPAAETMQDYKRNEAVSFDYVCQLHHLGRIAAEAGLKLQGRLLCALDYENWELDVRMVEYDHGLMNEIIETGNRLWFDHVLEGRLPEIPRAPVFEDISEVDRAKMDALAAQITMLKTVGTVSAEMASEIAAELSRISENYEIADARINLSAGTIKADQMLDTDLLDVLAQRHGLPVVDEKDEAGIEALVERLDALGEPRSRYIREIHKFGLSRKKKGPEFEFISAQKVRAKELLTDHVRDPSATAATSHKP